MLSLLPGKLNDVKAVNLDNVLWKFPEYGFSEKIRNPIRSFNSTSIGHQLRVMRKKGKRNIHKSKKKKNVDVLFVRNPSEKNDPEHSKKPTPARPSWSFDDAFRFRSHQGRNLQCVYHQRASIGRKWINNKLSDLKPCKSCTNFAEDTTNKITISDGSNERNSKQFEKFPHNSLKRLSGKETYKSMETPAKISIDKDKANNKQNIIENASIREYFDVGCGDGGLVQETQTFSNGGNRHFQEYANDIRQYTYNGKLRHPRCQGRSTLSTILGYILCGLITIVWSPCIITFLLFWFITYPLRPQSVGAPWQSGDNKKRSGLPFYTCLNSEVWPITIFNNLCAIQSKSKSKFNHPHVPNLERKYSLNHKRDKAAVIKPTTEKIICHQPHVRDKKQTHFLYNRNNVNRVRRVEKRRTERIADFYNNTTSIPTRSALQSKISRRACHENFPLANIQKVQTVMRLECRKPNENPFLGKTVNFPHAFGNTTPFQEPQTVSMAYVCPPLRENTNRRVPCQSLKKTSKNKKHQHSPTRCEFQSKYYLPCSPIMQPCYSDLGMKRHNRKNKVSVRCIPCKTSVLKRSSSTCKKYFKSCEGENVLPCHKQVKLCLNKNACGDCGKIRVSDGQTQCRAVKFSEQSQHRSDRPKRKRKHYHHKPHMKSIWNRFHHKPYIKSNWNRFKSLFMGECHSEWHDRTVNRDLATLRPYHIFFGPYNTKPGFRGFFSSCWRLFKSLCRVCLIVSTVFVWGPVFLIVYIIYTCFCFCI